MRFLRTRGMTLLMVLCLAIGSLGATASVSAKDDKPTISVGAVAYTEQSIVAEMTALILEDAGFEVERKFDLASEVVLHQAYLSGDVDVGVQYTGSGLVAMLGMDVPEPAADGSASPADSIADQTYSIVSREFEDQFGLIWLEPLGFNNTYALAVTAETAEARLLTNISDLQGQAGDMTIGVDATFPSRPDGLPGLEETYGLTFDDVVVMQSGLMYSAVAQGDVDIISAYSTDGRIPAQELILLEDDKAFFPPYYAAPVVNGDLLEEYPEIGELLNQLAGEFDNAIMAEMNYQVDEAGAEPTDVARAFLEEHGIIGGED